MVVAQIAPECECIVIARRKLFAQIRDMGVQLARPSWAIALFGKLIGPQAPPHGLTTDVKVSCNRPNAMPLLVKRMNLRVAGDPAIPTTLAIVLSPCPWLSCAGVSA